MFNEITPLSPASLSSLGSPSATLKRKQPSPAKKEEVPTAVFFDSASKAAARSAAGYTHPLLDGSPAPIPMGGAAGPTGISSATKKARTASTLTQQAAAAVEAQQNHIAMMSYIEREWATAAARNGGDNAFGAYMASIGQLSQVHPQQQQMLQRLQQPQLQQQMLSKPLALPQPIVSKPAIVTSNATLQQHYQQVQQVQQMQQMQQVHHEEEEEVVEQQEHKPLTKAKRNKLQAIDLISLVHSVQLDDDEDEIYDSCPVVAEKITQFLKMDGVNKKIFLEHAIDQKDGYVQLKAFVDGSNQAECANKTYGKAYIFFERLRLLEGREKSEERLRNEALYPYGISTNEPDAQIVSHNLLHKGADQCEESDEMDEEDSETDLRCYDHFA